jgi:diaminopimelate epimerase
MQKISFSKMSGAGNDFIIIDKDFSRDLVLSNDIIIKLCDRHNGIGADGLITIAGSKDYDFVMEYFNADGSTGSLCGNGARCAISFAADKFSLLNKIRFLSNGVEYTAEILGGDKIRFYFNEPGNLKMDFKIKAGGQLINADYINTGSPHIVININEIAKEPSKPELCYSSIEEVPVYSLGREIRYLPEFAPGGTNVNFINGKGGKLRIRTYERGVENETLSCGTGAAASALIGFFRNEIKPPVTLITAGGDELIVDFKFEDEMIKELSLTGPVLNTFTGEFLLSKYL